MAGRRGSWLQGTRGGRSGAWAPLPRRTRTRSAPGAKPGPRQAGRTPASPMQEVGRLASRGRTGRERNLQVRRAAAVGGRERRGRIPGAAAGKRGAGRGGSLRAPAAGGRGAGIRRLGRTEPSLALLPALRSHGTPPDTFLGHRCSRKPDYGREGEFPDLLALGCVWCLCFLKYCDATPPSFDKGLPLLCQLRRMGPAGSGDARDGGVASSSPPGVALRPPRRGSWTAPPCLEPIPARSSAESARGGHGE